MLALQVCGDDMLALQVCGDDMLALQVCGDDMPAPHAAGLRRVAAMDAQVAGASVWPCCCCCCCDVMWALVLVAGCTATCWPVLRRACLSLSTVVPGMHCSGSASPCYILIHCCI
jgi:hypothetical protein